MKVEIKGYGTIECSEHLMNEISLAMQILALNDVRHDRHHMSTEHCKISDTIYNELDKIGYYNQFK